jgi:hypothetical protein
MSTPPGFFDDMPPLNVRDAPADAAMARDDPPVISTSTKSSQKRSGKTSGQTVQNEIAELELRLSQLRQSEPIELTKKPVPSQAKRIVQQNILNAARRDPATATSVKIQEVTPVRTRPGEFLEQAIRDTARSRGGNPPSEPSSSSSNDESDEESSNGSRKPRKKSKKSKKNKTLHKMLLKPIPPRKYDGSSDATLFYRLCRKETSSVKVGRIPASEQMFFLSYYMTRTALAFYEQVAIRKQITVLTVCRISSWTCSISASLWTFETR